MKRKIRMTESDLRRIVKKAINEIANDEQGNDEEMYELYKKYYYHQIECGAYLENMLWDYGDKIPPQVCNKIHELDDKIGTLYSQIEYMIQQYYPGISDFNDDELFA